MPNQEKYKVIGWQYGTFTARDNGRLVDYCNLFVLAPFVGEESDHFHFMGMKVQNFRCTSSEVVKDLQPKDEVTLFFDQRGRVSMAQVVTK